MTKNNCWDNRYEVYARVGEEQLSAVVLGAKSVYEIEPLNGKFNSADGRYEVSWNVPRWLKESLIEFLLDRKVFIGCKPVLD
jgi:hypothetical protein